MFFVGCATAPIPQEVTKEYWDNGKLKSEGHYKNGKLDGPMTWWKENGKKDSERYYKDGKKEDFWTWWFKSGAKRSEGHFKDGKKMDFGLNGMKRERKHFKETL